MRNKTHKQTHTHKVPPVVHTLKGFQSRAVGASRNILQFDRRLLLLLLLLSVKRRDNLAEKDAEEGEEAFDVQKRGACKA